MRLKCLHGYFILEETEAGQISDFQSLFGLDIVPKNNYFTFANLLDAPDYSLAGKSFLGIQAIETFEGKPWEVFEANGFVYNFSSGLMVPISSVTQLVRIELAGNKYISDGLILPGSLTAEGLRVRDYSAWYSSKSQRFYYSEVGYV